VLLNDERRYNDWHACEHPLKKTKAYSPKITNISLRRTRQLSSVRPFPGIKWVVKHTDKHGTNPRFVSCWPASSRERLGSTASRSTPPRALTNMDWIQSTPSLRRS
jgi:hypothetical protein